MKAVAFFRDSTTKKSSPLKNVEIPIPVPNEHDILVEVKAVSVNPIDYKVHNSQVPAEGEMRIPGWDAAGVVISIGSKVTLFKPGDEVWYAGSIDRPGSFEEYQLVDERIVSLKPTKLDFAEAAALPLTSLFSWEMIFDRMNIPKEVTEPQKNVLIIGASGGVGSIMCQLLLELTQTKIIGTASRQVGVDWLNKIGIDLVIDHTKPMLPQLQNLGIANIDYVICLNGTSKHYDEITNIIAPEGHFGFSDEPAPLDLTPLKMKSVTINLELMFTRPLFHLKDMIRQHEILDSVAKLVDEGVIDTTVAQNFGIIDAENVTKALDILEAHQSHGKIVLTGF